MRGREAVDERGDLGHHFDCEKCCLFVDSGSKLFEIVYCFPYYFNSINKIEPKLTENSFYLIIEVHHFAQYLFKEILLFFYFGFFKVVEDDFINFWFVFWK